MYQMMVKRPEFLDPPQKKQQKRYGNLDFHNNAHKKMSYYYEIELTDNYTLFSLSGRFVLRSLQSLETS